MRLLTYNIHKGIGGSDRLYNLGRVVRVIAEAEPDLVCLQEVARNARRSHYHDQPAVLAKELNAAAHLFQLNVRYREGGYGNLILSRWPFQSEFQVSLRLRRRKPRGAQLVVVDTPAGPLHLVNWHLGLAERERRWQVAHLLGHPLFQQSAHLPTLVVGDFNDWRNCLGRHRFAGHDFHQATSPVRRFRSFPAFMAVASLDKVFYRGGGLLRRAHPGPPPPARPAPAHPPPVIAFGPPAPAARDRGAGGGAGWR